MTDRRSPLDAIHRALEAKMVPFGGWDMPLSYPSGTLAEHRACREGAVVFDVSHLGTVRVEGSGATDVLQRTFTNDLHKVAPGRAQYTHLLDPTDASVVDDIIVWWLDNDRFDVMPNASNTTRVIEALEGTSATDVTGDRALLAIQGPHARRALSAVWPDAAEVKRFRVASLSWQGAPCSVAGTGYTGEDGVEVAIPAEAAADLWGLLVDAGVTPAGLGARDTLRLEAGLPLHGHELGPGITPLQAGLGWVVSWDKGAFRGREALAAERDRGPARVLRGLHTEGRRPPRADAEVCRGDEVVGTVTSGNFSPMLGHGIALALVQPTVAPTDELSVVLRGASLSARIVDTPFVAPTPAAPA